MIVVAVRTVHNTFLAGPSTLVHEGRLFPVEQKHIFHSGHLLIGAVAPSEVLQAFRRLRFQKLSIIDAYEVAAGNVLPLLQQTAGDAPFEALFGWDAELFYTDGKIVLQPTDNFCAIGTGREYALGTFPFTSTAPPDKRLMAALSVASRFVPEIRKPFFVESTLTIQQMQL